MLLLSLTQDQRLLSLMCLVNFSWKDWKRYAVKQMHYMFFLMLKLAQKRGVTGAPYTTDIT